MSHEVHGELVPVGGGDSIPLIRPVLTVGRRETCDICMKFPNVSGLHAELSFREGYWFIRDLNSTNGIKVNGVRVNEKRVYPKDELSIGKRSFVIQYTMPSNRHAMEELEEDIMSQSLLERAGLAKPERDNRPKPRGRSISTSDLLDDDDDD